MDMDPNTEDVDEEYVGQPIVNNKSNPPDLDRKSTSHLFMTLMLLIKLVHPTTLSFPPGPFEPSLHPPTTSVLSTIHIRALECLNNLFLAAEEAQGDGPAVSSVDMRTLKALWDDLWGALAKVGKIVKDGKVVTSRGLEKKTEMWEVALGVLWGIARVGRGKLVSVPPFHSG